MIVLSWRQVGYVALGTAALISAATLASSPMTTDAAQFFQRAFLDLTRGGSIGGDTSISGDAGVSKNLQVEGTLVVRGFSVLDAGANLGGDLYVQGDAGVSNNLGVTGNATIGGTVTVPTLTGASATTVDLNSSVASGTTAYTVDATANLTSGNHTCFRDNGTTSLLCVTFDGVPVTQSPGNSKVRGIILISGGTGTATVGTGCFATCTNQTSLAPVQCAVSSTTLTATTALDDTVTYHCDY